MVGPTGWAKPVAPPDFLIRKVLARDTFGVQAGPKKSLKTHDNQALGLSAATGLPLYRHPEFVVPRPVKVLYIVGEGGEKPVTRVLQRMARAYGLSLDEIVADPAFPLVLAFGAAALNSTELRGEVRALLDEHQPGLVLTESFYNFHPADVEASNLYARGGLIDSYHMLIRTECEGATSLMTDHYRSTNTGRTLDLDAISMAGQAENADSWITRHHRNAPDVGAGVFTLRQEFGSRQWGATRWTVEWHLGGFNHDLGSHDGDITWDITSEIGGAAGVGDEEIATVVFVNDHAGHMYLQKYVREHPNMTKTEIQDAMQAVTKLPRQKVRELWAKTQELGLITRRSVRREENDPQTGDTRLVTRAVWFPGTGEDTLAEDLRTWGGETEQVSDGD